MRIEGFQAHDKLDVSFDPLITTIVGDSDRGKSSIIRALRWCCLNRPRGDGFIRSGFKRMKIRIKIDDTTVRRERGGGENVYALDEQEYRAFSNDVPDSIQKLLNVADINFCSQHDAPFWFDFSPPEIARQLNKIVDLNAIDEVTASLGQMIRSTRSELGMVENRLAQAEAEYKELDYVSKVDSELEEVERKEEESQNLRSSFEQIEKLVGELNQAESRIKQFGALVQEGNHIASLGDLAQGIDEKINRLMGLVGSLADTEKLVGQEVPVLDELETLLEKNQSVDKRINQLSLLIQQGSKQTLIIEEGQQGLEQVKERLSSELGGMCPICGGNMQSPVNTV
jgi:chromosome segregation ATPase